MLRPGSWTRPDLALMVFAAMVAAGPAVGQSGEALKVIFVCRSAECSAGFEGAITTALRCLQVLHPGKYVSSADKLRAGEGASVVVKYGPATSERSTAPLVKHADSYAVENLYAAEVIDSPGCIRLDKYVDGTRNILAGLFQVDPSGALTESSAACLDVMKDNLRADAGWCISVQVPSLPMR